MEFIWNSWVLVPFVLACVAFGYVICFRRGLKIGPKSFPGFFALVQLGILVCVSLAIIHENTFFRIVFATSAGWSAGSLVRLIQVESRRRSKLMWTAYELAKERSDLMHKK